MAESATFINYHTSISACTKLAHNKKKLLKVDLVLTLNTNIAMTTHPKLNAAFTEGEGETQKLK